MVNTVGLPPNVQSAINIRYGRVRELQRVKRCYLSCYGRSRGLYEHDCQESSNVRKAAADDWRYVRERLRQNGFDPRRMVKILSGGGND